MSKAYTALRLARASEDMRKRAHLASIKADEAFSDGNPHAEEMAWDYLRLKKLADEADIAAHNAQIEAEEERGE